MYIIGTGARGRCDLDLARSLGLNVHGFYEPIDSRRVGTSISDVPVLGMVEDFVRPTNIVISLGDVHKRAEIQEQLKDFTLVYLLSRESFISELTVLGPGLVAYPSSVIASYSSLGTCVKVDSGCVISHDCIIGDYVNFAAGVILGGRVEVGSFTQLHVGCRVVPDVRIGSDCVIGAGAVVTRDIPDGWTVMGNPARRI